jgi:hypothetical protein
MAAHSHGGSDDFDMAAHTQTWGAFMKLVVWGIVGVILVLLFLLWIHFA